MIHSSTTFKEMPDAPPVIAFDDAKGITNERNKTPLSQLQITEKLSEKELVEDTNLYLSLILSLDQQVLIPSHQVIEIISIAPTQITPIPEVENPIMGIYSWRGEILWVVDGSSLLGDTALYNRHFWSPRYSIVVVRESGEHIGIMVPEVGNLGKRSRFCNHTDPPRTTPLPRAGKQTNPAPEKIPKENITCLPIVDLIDRIAQLRHQLRASWN